MTGGKLLIQDAKPAREVPCNIQQQNAVLCRHLFEEAVEGHRGDREHRGLGGGLNGGQAWQGVEDTTFAKEVFCAERTKLNLIGFSKVFEESHTAASNDKENIAGFSFMNDHATLGKLLSVGVFQKQF